MKLAVNLAPLLSHPSRASFISGDGGGALLFERMNEPTLQELESNVDEGINRIMRLPDDEFEDGLKTFIETMGGPDKEGVQTMIKNFRDWRAWWLTTQN